VAVTEKTCETVIVLVMRAVDVTDAAASSGRSKRVMMDGRCILDVVLLRVSRSVMSIRSGVYSRFEIVDWIFERRAMKLVRARLCQRSLVGMDGCEGVNWRKKQEEAQED
jgi:hypothetical protein